MLDLVVQALREARWLAAETSIQFHDSPNLLSALAETCDGKPRDWLQHQVARGASLQLLRPEQPAVSDWLGPRLCFSPRGVAPRRLVGMASSRLGRRLATQQAWFTAFRAACSKIHPHRECLLTAESTTTARFVERAAELFGVHVLSIVTPSADTSLTSWLRRLRTVEDTPGNVQRMYLSPALAPASIASPLDAFPLRDRCVVALAERLLVFHLRGGGQLEALVRTRLSDARWPAASLFVALGDGLVEQNMANGLLDLGAVGWIVLDSSGERETEPQPARCATSAAIVKLPSASNWQFLTHWTRDQSGLWPDETEEQFVDGLLRGDAVDHTAMTTLERILRTQRLLASSRLVRGGVPVVSFTALPLVDLPKMRTYRRHLGRWDFEPYGLCIRQQSLVARGSKPVRYGDESTWQGLPAAERPFFHKNRGRLAIDWSAEREWRHVGDLDLTSLSAEEAFVFVPSRTDAARIAGVSRWPVAVLPDDRRRA